MLPPPWFYLPDWLLDMLDNYVNLSDVMMTCKWQLEAWAHTNDKIWSLQSLWLLSVKSTIKLWQVDMIIWQVSIKIWLVDITSWQVVAELCHHRCGSIQIKIWKWPDSLYLCFIWNFKRQFYLKCWYKYECNIENH